MAKELGVGFRATSGRSFPRRAISPLCSQIWKERDVLFIDEIHRLNPAVEEILYLPWRISSSISSSRGARGTLRAHRSVEVHAGWGYHTGGPADDAAQDRFGIPVRLNFYTVEELERVVTPARAVLGAAIAPDGEHEIARRSRGTPRIAGRLLRRVRDFAAVASAPVIDRRGCRHRH